MNRRTFLAATVATFAITSRLIAAGPIRLRVLSYNIHHGEGLDGKLDLERIAGVIKAAKPDLVSLQEVDRGATRTGKADQLAKLAELTGMKSAFGQAMAYDGGGYGIGILSRFEIGATRTVPLPGAPKEEPRCLLLADVSVPDDSRPGKVRQVRFGATHLNHRNAAERLAQAKHMLTAVPADIPAIIAGDLNAVPESPEIRALTEKYLDATARPLPARADPRAEERLLTWPADRPRSKIDYVLPGPAAAWRAIEAVVIPEAVASDHRPVLAVIELVG